MILIIIVLAGVITIYSIYYVNMSERIREFGQLKALGAKKLQIKKIILLEGMGITVIALPIGLLTGTLLIKAVFAGLVRMYDNENTMVSVISDLMKEGELSYYHAELYLLTIAVTLITVYISLSKPMSVAAGISEIEAMRYERNNSTAKTKKKKTRKSSKSMGVFRLSQIYLLGNKKNSMITVLSMSATGIFIILIATVLACADPAESANNSIMGQYQIQLKVETGNKEHPEREWNQVILNNPLTEELKNEIEQMDGITSVSCHNGVHVLSESFDNAYESFCGIPEEHSKMLMDGIIRGSITYEELQNSNKIIVDNNLLDWYPDLQIGDVIALEILDGTGQNRIEVEIAAIGDYPIGFTNYSYLLTAYSQVERLCEGNLNEVYMIFADKSYDEMVFQRLWDLTEDNEILAMNTWKSEYETWKSSVSLTSAGCYAFLGIIAAICIMNMINTMINSVQVRKKEIGIMQAIGMTDRQLVRMLQQEGMFYILGTLVLSLGVGSLAGYPLFLWAKKNAIFNISTYHYPWETAIIVTAVLVIIQILLAAALAKSARKKSLIERIRFSE